MKNPTTTIRLGAALLKIRQLENDLKAAKIREEMHRADELKLVDRIGGLVTHQKTLDAALNKMIEERNDWRDAFKLIMKLVK